MNAALVDAIDRLAREVEALKKAARQPERLAYRPREVADLTGIGYEVVLDLIRSGELAAVRVGRLHVVPAPAVTALLDRVGDVIALDEHRRSA